MKTPKPQHPRPATVADEQALYEATPSFVDLLPWVEFLPDSQCLLLEDGESVAAFFELTPIGTEGREASWLRTVRDALENALQDSFDELEEQPWVLQLYAQDETDWGAYLHSLGDYVQPRARGSAFTDCYLQMFRQHLEALSQPGGLFEDTVVTQLPWRGQSRKVRLVVYRRSKGTPTQRGQSSEQALNSLCERLSGGLGNAGVRTRRLDGAQIHRWLLRWFNPDPKLLGNAPEQRQDFYRLADYPPDDASEELSLASGSDFAQRLFFEQPRALSQVQPQPPPSSSTPKALTSSATSTSTPTTASSPESLPALKPAASPFPLPRPHPMSQRQLH